MNLLPLVIRIIERHPHGVPAEVVKGAAADVVKGKPLVHKLHEFDGRERVLKAEDAKLPSVLLEVPQHRGHLKQNMHCNIN